MTDEKTETVDKPRIEIDRERALLLLAEAVAERGGNFVYTPTLKNENSTSPGCFYARDGEPSCGVGLAMFNAGVPIEELEKWDSDGGGYIGSVFDHYFSHPESNVDMTLEAVRVFEAFQRPQDDGAKWGDALAQAYEAKTAMELA